MVLYLVKDKRMVLQERPEYCNTATMLVHGGEATI